MDNGTRLWFSLLIVLMRGSTFTIGISDLPPLRIERLKKA